MFMPYNKMREYFAGLKIFETAKAQKDVEIEHAGNKRLSRL